LTRTWQSWKSIAALAPFVKPEHIKVFELNPKVPLGYMTRSVAHLKKIWGGE
jgi:hypothetical protein